jgi:hypothetical protein
MSTHSIGDDVQTELIVDEEGVLVRGSLAPEIGQGVAGSA